MRAKLATVDSPTLATRRGRRHPRPQERLASAAMLGLRHRLRGLDHVLASGKNVKVLVLDTEVYSNTGGQMSKSTPRGALPVAAGGKTNSKKDLAMEAVAYGPSTWRASHGIQRQPHRQAFQEAEAWPGPAIIIAYSHCIAHGYDLSQGLDHQKAAVNSGYWPLMRYNPLSARKEEPVLPRLASAFDPAQGLHL